MSDGNTPDPPKVPPEVPGVPKDTTGRQAVSEVLGSRYEIVEKLGAGAFGEVYRARDSVLHREVAIKRIRLDAFAEGDLLDEVKTRFLNEARVAAQLKHPNIVTTYDIVDSDTSSFMVLELVAGETLQSRLKRQGRLSLDETYQILKQVAAALDFAHAAKVYHRDIKPANIMIEPSGEVRVMDFGIAKAEGSTNITATGNIIGTPNYMSPEQARGDKVDGRADIFSLGCVLYECLSGERPFKGKNITGILMEILTREPSPIDVERLGLPESVQRTVTRALAKDPAARTASGAEVMQSLVGAAADNPVLEASGISPEAMPTQSVPNPSPAMPVETSPTQSSAVSSPPAPPPIPSGHAAAPAPSVPVAPTEGLMTKTRSAWLAAAGLVFLVIVATQVLTDSSPSGAEAAIEWLEQTSPGARESELVEIEEVGFVGKMLGRAPTVRLTIPSGASLGVSLMQSLSSEDAKVNDPVVATLSAPIEVEGLIAVQAGTEVHGHVSHSAGAGKVSGVGELSIEFDKLRLPDGDEILIEATPIVRKAERTRKRDAAKIGGAAGLGAVVGGLFGGKKGAAIGATVGGSAGAGAVAATKGNEVTLAEGAALSFEISSPFKVVAVPPAPPSE